MLRVLRYAFVILSILGCAAFAPFAQAAEKLILTVRAKGTGDPMSRVEVKLGEAKLLTDKQGVVELSLPDGEGTLEIYRASYELQAIPFAQLRGKAKHEVYLMPATPQDNEIVVRGVRRPETSRKTVSVDEAVKVAPGGDPAQVPKLLPGVQSSSFSPEIVVRGSGPFDSRYHIENFDVPFIFHRIGGISVVPDQLLSDVEFSTGGFGAQYGGATGGVISLRTKTEVPERENQTEFRINLPIYSSIFYQRRIDENSYFALSARRSYLEAFLPLVMPKDAGLTVAPRFGDTHFYYLRTREDGHTKVLAMYAYDGLQAVFPSEMADDEDGRSAFSLRDSACLLGVEWKKVINQDWTLTVSPQVSRTSLRVDIIDNRIHIDAWGPQVHVEGVRKLQGRDRLYVGALPSYTIGKADVYAPKVDNNDPFFDVEEAPKIKTTVQSGYTSLASWVAFDQTFGELTLTPGLRAFYASAIKRAGLDPRLNARFKLTAQHTLKGAVGQYSQEPEFQDSSEDFGNPHLHFIRSNHYVLGLETNWSDTWHTDFQVYHKDTKNLVRSNAETNKDNSGSLLSSGFEAFVRRNLTSRLFGWASYTYSRTRERDSDRETYRNSQYDQTHVLNLAGNYKLSALWETGGRAVYHTGDTYTKIDDAVYNANLDKYQPRSSKDQRLYDGRLPPYHEIDLYLNREVFYDTWKLAWRFGLEMLALKRPVQSVQHNYDYSKEQYFTGVPVIPYVELRGTL